MEDQDLECPTLDGSKDSYLQQSLPLEVVNKYSLCGQGNNASVLYQCGDDAPQTEKYGELQTPFSQSFSGHLQNLIKFQNHLGPTRSDIPLLGNDLGNHLNLISTLPSSDMNSISGHSSAPPPPLPHSLFSLPTYPITRPTDLFGVMNPPIYNTSSNSVLPPHTLSPSLPLPSLPIPNNALHSAYKKSADLAPLGTCNELPSQDLLHQCLQSPEKSLSLLPSSFLDFHRTMWPVPPASASLDPVPPLKNLFLGTKQFLEDATKLDELPVSDARLFDSANDKDSLPESDLLPNDDHLSTSSQSQDEEIDLIGQITDDVDLEKTGSDQDCRITASYDQNSLGPLNDLPEESGTDINENNRFNKQDAGFTCESSKDDKEEDDDDDDEVIPIKLNRVVFCSVCRKGYGTPAALDKHMQTHAPHNCEVCGKTFPRLYNLKIHMTVHAERTISCDECGKSYKSMATLQAHKNTVHQVAEGSSIICDICGVVLKNRKSLLQHEQMHTLGKRFSCDVCNEKFHRKDALNRHIVRIHVEERFFTCQVCGTRFNTNETLQDHLKIHESERPHECNCCKRRFPQRSALERHMRSHTGEKPFTCRVCGLAFSRSYRLKYHLQQHSGVQKNQESDLMQHSQNGNFQEQ